MTPSRGGSGTTWLFLGCRMCRKRFQVKWDAPPGTRACPSCHAPILEGRPGPKLLDLLADEERKI